MSVKKKIVEDLIEFTGLYIIILLKFSSTQRHKDIDEATKQYELYKNLNPRYSENIIPLKEGKLKVDSSDIIYSLKYNIFRSY